MDSWLASNFVREVVLERKLQLHAVAMEAVGEVLPASPLEFAAEHDVWHWGAKQIAEDIMAAVVGVRCLAGGVVDVGHRVAERAGEFRTPGVIDEGDDTDDGKRLAHD